MNNKLPDYGYDWRPNTARRMRITTRVIGFLNRKLNQAITAGDTVLIAQVSSAIIKTSIKLSVLDTQSS